MKNAAIRQTFFSGGLFFLSLSCFFLPLSSSLMSIGCAGLILSWLLSGEIGNLPKVVRENRATWPPLLLFIMLFIGIFYSAAGWQESLMIFKKYRELIYFPIVLSFLLTERERRGSHDAAHRAKYALLAGMTTLMLLSYAMYFGWIATEKFGHSTIHHITHSLFMAILAFWALQKTLFSAREQGHWQRAGFFLLFLLAAANLLFIAFGRSGMVIFALLLVLTLVQRLRPAQTLLALLFLCGVLTGLYYSSDNLSKRIDASVQDVKNYQPGASRSSLGMRFDWWHNSLTLIKQAPLTGHGTGSFAAEQNKLVSTSGKATKLSDNPHNEYLLLGVQLGLPGVLVFLALLIRFFLDASSLPQENRILLQGVVLAFAWGSLANSWLLDSHPSHFLLITAAVLISEKETKPPPHFS